MAAQTTLIFTAANKAAAIEAIDTAKGWSAPFTWASNIDIELTDGTDTFWALSGWIDDSDLNILFSNDFVKHAHFPADLDAALTAYSMDLVN